MTTQDEKGWPAGHPDEVRIRAEIAHALEEIPCSPTIRRGELADLDEIISFFRALVQFADCNLYDNAWNLRNHLVPFKPGDEHYDAGGDEADDEVQP